MANQFIPGYSPQLVSAAKEKLRKRAASEELRNAICNNLSTDAVATIAALLQPTWTDGQQTERAENARYEVEWFASELTDLLGVQEHKRLIDELGL